MKRRSERIQAIIILSIATLFVSGCSSVETEQPASESVVESTSSEEMSEIISEEPVVETTSSEEVSEIISEVPEEVVKVDAGDYEVGVDIPSGEYALFQHKEADCGFVDVHQSGSNEFILSDSFINNSIITLNDGERVRLQDCYAVSYGAECIDTTGHGMFKVGVDIPSDEYFVYADDGSAIIMVYSDSRFQETSIIENIKFSGMHSITVNDGEYVRLIRCHFGIKY